MEIRAMPVAKICVLIIFASVEGVAQVPEKSGNRSYL